MESLTVSVYFIQVASATVKDHSMKMRLGVEVQLHTFLTPTLDGDDCSASCLAIMTFACTTQEAVQAQGMAKITPISSHCY
jgi:hypothetical protein